MPKYNQVSVKINTKQKYPKAKAQSEAPKVS